VAVVAMGHAWHDKTFHPISPFRFFFRNSLAMTREHGRYPTFCGKSAGALFNGRPYSRLECQEDFEEFVRASNFLSIVGTACLDSWRLSIRTRKWVASPRM